MGELDQIRSDQISRGAQYIRGAMTQPHCRAIIARIDASQLVGIRIVAGRLYASYLDTSTVR